MGEPLQSLKDFIGNEHAVKQLSLLISEAKANDGNGTMPNICILGPYGNGKTSLIRLMAQEIGRHYVYINSVICRTPTTLRNAIVTPDNLARGAVVFLDECHKLPNSVQDNALSFLQRPSILQTVYKEQIIRDPLPNTISFAFATTHKGLMRDALLSRLEEIELHEYTTAEKQRMAAQILIKGHGLSPQHIDLDAVLEIGRRARSGRHVEKHCDNIMRYMALNKFERLTLDVAKAVFEILNLDENGLTKLDRNLLAYLQQRGGCGLDTLEAALNLTKREIKDKIEPFLLRRGLIARHASGRAITDRGMAALSGERLDV